MTYIETIHYMLVEHDIALLTPTLVSDIRPLMLHFDYRSHASFAIYILINKNQNCFYSQSLEIISPFPILIKPFIGTNRLNSVIYQQVSGHNINHKDQWHNIAS